VNGRGPRDRGGGPRGGGAPRGGGPPDRRGPPARERFDDRREPPAREHADAGPVRGPGERIVYGVGPVRELVARRASSIVAVWVDPRRADKSAGDPVAQIVTAARAAGIRVEDRDRELLDRAVGEEARHQGIVAWVGALAYVDVDALLEGAPRADGSHEPALIVALDGVEDPRNLGAVLRSAYLLGASGVIIPEHRAAQVTAIVSKTSAGASELLPIAQVGNLVRALEELRELGVWRVAVHATDAAQPIERVDLKGPTVLVLGAEGSGVRPLVAKNCDFHAVIPMARSGVGSFNVSVAAALALYEARRQRG